MPKPVALVARHQIHGGVEVIVASGAGSMHQEFPHNDHKNNRNADYGTDDARPIHCVLFPHA